MITVDARARIRKAYYIDNKSIRQIARELHHGRDTVRKAIESPEPESYTLTQPRPAPVLGAYMEQIDELLKENEHLPKKQRRTGRQIYETLCQAGYTGSASRVRGYIAEQRRKTQQRKVYLPLEFDPGQDAQVDWGCADVILNGERITVELFCMRLCYSRRLFVMAFPAQKQEAFFAGHVHAFHFFGGVPHRITYDNLKAAVQRILKGRTRQEQQRFTVFRSHYLYESRFCNLGAGHEKGRVEKGVGYGRRNYLAAVPEFASFDELNAHLLTCCRKDDARTVDRQPITIGEAWELELPELRLLPDRDFECCVSQPVALNGYGQVEFETNRYSVPADQAYPQLLLRAYPFRIEIVHLDTLIATHPRCYQRHQDVLDPLHYLPLLEQRPGAFEHAKPLRRWRKTWPPIYERLLKHLQAKLPEGEGVREFIRILRLHDEYTTETLAEAISQALEYGCGRLDGVQLCLRQLTAPETSCSALDLTAHPELSGVGEQPLDLARYDRLLEGAAP